MYSKRPDINGSPDMYCIFILLTVDQPIWLGIFTRRVVFWLNWPGLKVYHTSIHD